MLPPTFSVENIDAYLRAEWSRMTDVYRGCAVPWSAADITAEGDVAPCHVFYDFVVGNLEESSFEEICNGENYRKFRAYMTDPG